MKEWAYIVWFPEHGAHLVHPDDASRLGSGAQGVVGEIQNQEGGWVVFAFDGASARVNRSLLTPCSAPAFRVGEAVRTVPPRAAVQSSVRSIRWHFKRQQSYFLLGGHNKSRYWAEELQSLAQQGFAADACEATRR